MNWFERHANWTGGTVERPLLAVVLLTITFGLIFSSCQQYTNNILENITSKPPTIPVVVPPPLSPKPYPGLDTRISELVTAYETGGDAAAEAYAKTNRLLLDGGRVFVEIQVRPGTKDTVVNAVRNVGAENIRTSQYFDGLDAFIPLNQIKSLANNPDITEIGQPRISVPKFRQGP